MRNDRKIYLDLAKIIALFMVTWGHLVGVSTYALEIPGVVGKAMTEPLLPVTEHNLWCLESFLYNTFGIQLACVGVVIFFLISGYLIPDMQSKYGHNEKIFALYYHCIKRIIPVLVVCVIFDGVFLYITQGISYPLKNYLATMTGVPFLFKQDCTIGVLWFLTTLLLTYICASIIREFQFKDILLLYVLLFVMTVFPIYIQRMININIWMLNSLAYYSRMITIPLIGTMFRLMENDHCKKITKVLTVTLSTLCTVLIIFSYQELYGLYETYCNISTFISAYIVIAFCWLISKIKGVKVQATVCTPEKSFDVKSIKLAQIF